MSFNNNNNDNNIGKSNNRFICNKQKEAYIYICLVSLKEAYMYIISNHKLNLQSFGSRTVKGFRVVSDHKLRHGKTNQLNKLNIHNKSREYLHIAQWLIINGSTINWYCQKLSLTCLKLASSTFAASCNGRILWSRAERERERERYSLWPYIDLSQKIEI